MLRRFGALAISLTMLAPFRAQAQAKPSSAECASDRAAPLAPRRFAFPRDDGAHDGYPVELWRTFGRVTDEAGKSFDFTVNVSRFRIDTHAATVPANASRWFARHFVTTSFAILDDQTLHSERASFVDREGDLGAATGNGNGLSLEARALTYAMVPRSSHAPGYFALTVRDSDGANALSLNQTPSRTALPLGPGGVVQTGSCPTNQAYAYAYTRSATHGTLRFAGADHRVSGSTWIEHEFAHTELSPSDVGWSRFEIQFDDGRDLDARLTRDAAGRMVATSGVLVSAAGRVTYLTPGSVETRLPPDATERDAIWHSDASDVTYPAMWYFLTKPGHFALATVEMTHDQELRAPARAPYYWGAIVVEEYGPPGGDPGHGFVELTGYGGRHAL